MDFTEETLLTLYVGEADKSGHRPVYEALLDLLQGHGISGATVFRGIAGFGNRSLVHTQKLLELSHDLPVVIEVVDDAGKIDGVLPRIEAMMTGGLVTLQPIRSFRPKKPGR